MTGKFNHTMKLNADIGEGFGMWKMGNDAELMQLIDQANIACGYHAGDANTMQRTIALAVKNNVQIGAHVSYPDLQGFGRRSMQLPEYELIAMIQAQIACLDGLAKCQKAKVAYVKPHGALYNDMMKDERILETVVKAVADYYEPLHLMVQALSDNQISLKLADQYNVPLIFEAFSDRAYNDDARLVSRIEKNAMLTTPQALQHCEQLIQDHTITSINQVTFSLNADSICVHGDNTEAINLCRRLKTLVDEHKVKQ